MNSVRPSVLCLDLGGVVVRICRTWREACATAGVEIRLDADSVSEELLSKRATFVDQHQRGALDLHRFIEVMGDLLQHQYTAQELTRIHESWILGDYPGMERLLLGLRASGMRVACLSNTNAHHWEQMTRSSGAFNAIEHRHASHLLELTKPNREIYRAFEEAMGASGAQILFADDLVENVQAAAAHGWQTIHIDHTGDPAHQLTQELARLGVPVNSVRDMPSPLCSRCASTTPALGGTIKIRASDFLVDELPLYEPSGEGEHLYLGIHKQDMAHDEMLRVIAAHFQVDVGSIGTAGMKDRHAITRQTVSVNLPASQPATQLTHDRLAILWSRRHANKLRTGHLSGNRFVIRVRDVDPLKAPQVFQRLRSLQQHGIPNAFGSQRFGMRLNNHRLGRLVLEDRWTDLVSELTGMSNLPCPEHQLVARRLCDEGKWSESISQWGASDHAERKVAAAMARGWKPSRAIKSLGGATLRLWINALQSAIFNRVLDERIAAGTIGTLAVGDIAYRHGPGSCFVVDQSETQESIASRAKTFEISPTGPLMGDRLLHAADKVYLAEQAAAAYFGVNESTFANSSEPPSGARRPLRVPLTNSAIDAGTDEFGGYIRLSFELPPGAFATELLGALLGPLTDASQRSGAMSSQRSVDSSSESSSSSSSTSSPSNGGGVDDDAPRDASASTASAT